MPQNFADPSPSNGGGKWERTLWKNAGKVPILWQGWKGSWPAGGGGIKEILVRKFKCLQLKKLPRSHWRSYNGQQITILLPEIPDESGPFYGQLIKRIVHRHYKAIKHQLKSVKNSFGGAQAMARLRQVIQHPFPWSVYDVWKCQASKFDGEGQNDQQRDVSKFEANQIVR